MVQCMASPTRSITPDFDLDRLNCTFEGAHPRDILSWCIDNIPQGLVQTSAFSMLVITDMLYRDLKANPAVPVIFLDTLHHFPETLATVEKAREIYGLDVRVYRARGVDSRETFAARYGEALWESDVNRFHYLTKVEPLQRALREMEVVGWVNGRRREQSHTRRNLAIFEQDANGRLKVNPLATWSRKQLWTYTFEHNVPYNPLFDQGFASIGDEPLTTPVAAGEDERGGSLARQRQNGMRHSSLRLLTIITHTPLQLHCILLSSQGAFLGLASYRIGITQR